MEVEDAALDGNVDNLKVKNIIGFDGNIIGGFRIHPDKKHVVYPLGNKVSVQNWYTKQQDFLTGHTNLISAIDVSHTGDFIASGQINHIGFKAWVIVWDFKTRSLHSKHELHKVRVEAVAFSREDSYLISIGGRDCGTVVVWDIAAKHPLCGADVSRGSQGDCFTLAASNRRDPCFITGGDCTMMLWQIDTVGRHVASTDVNMSKLKRVIYSMVLNIRDEICYCGTSTGDVLKIRLNYHHDSEVLEPIKPPMMQGCYTKISKKRLPRGHVELYQQGVRSLYLLDNGQLLIGAGNGILELVEEKAVSDQMRTHGAMKSEAETPGFKLPSLPMLRVLKTTSLNSGVTSIQLLNGKTILAGTTSSEIYSIDMDAFSPELLVTCHTSAIYDVTFPYDFSEVFATASKDDVRVWSMTSLQELLRIKVPNFSCSSVQFSHDGKAILTAWNDGVIRSFTPLTGRLIYAILNAHNKGVSALCITHNGKMLVSGGCEGQVRVWHISPLRQQLAAVLKDHKAPVSAIHINNTDDEAVSASTDGSCIIWDLIRHCRKQILLSNTLFMAVKYYPTGVQILTSGTDRKVGYWEVLDGTLVREVEGSPSGAVNAVDINANGEQFASGGDDQMVKLWNYQRGITTHVGLGHSAVITAICFSPNNKYIVSTSASGSIFVWHNPMHKQTPEASPVKSPEDDKPISIPELKASPKAGGDQNENIVDLPSSRSSRGSGASNKGQEVCACSCKKPVVRKGSCTCLPKSPVK